MSDRWTWAVVYRDGSRATEAELGTFGRVDLERCVAVEVWPARGWRKRPVVVTVDVDRGERAVFFRRRRSVLRFSAGALTPAGTLTVAGWTGPQGEGYVVASDDGRVRVVSTQAGV